MMTDNSYTPLENAFEQMINACFPPTISSEQIRLLKDAFFSGASAACGLMMDTPEIGETIKEELIDHADHLEAV